MLGVCRGFHCICAGPASANLVEAIIFVFVMRPYDVGDRVYHWTPENTIMQNSVVLKIDLLATTFKTWDERIYYLPNSVLAKRTVINIQRSSHQWHEFFIQVAANTPIEKIWQVSTMTPYCTTLHHRAIELQHWASVNSGCFLLSSSGNDRVSATMTDTRLCCFGVMFWECDWSRGLDINATSLPSFRLC